MKVIRIVPNLSSEAFVASRDFYLAMFDLVVSVELDDWYLQLMPESDTTRELSTKRLGLDAAASVETA
jgi:hypothetical protein